MKVVACTGVLGFIGRYVTDLLLNSGYRVYAIDAETYASDLSLLDHWQDAMDQGWLKYIRADIASLSHLPDVEAIINLAAETHVDNSLTDCSQFLHSNIIGVHRLLELIRGKRHYAMPRLIQISTDEVFGSVAEGTTPEDAPLAPSSPYAASKASADLLIQAYGTAYGLPWNIIRPSNCYGAYQYPEKLIPKAVRYFTLGKTMPVHADGSQTRSWLWVEDCARAILAVLESGKCNTIYNVPGDTEASVRDIVIRIWELVHGASEPQVRYEIVRPGLDHRYAVAGDALKALDWKPEGQFWDLLPTLVKAEQDVFRW